MEKPPLPIVGRKTSANPTTRNCLLNGLVSVLFNMLPHSRR